MKHQKNVIINKVCHSRKFLSGIYNARRYKTKGNALLNRYVEDPRVLRTAKSGMTTPFTTARGFTARFVIPQGRYAGYSGRVGFTLIELLVVVLIIGILAAVAVPQYQKAVLKSRYTAMMPLAKQLAEGNEVYYMEHGTYSVTPTELSVQGQAHYPDGMNVNIVDGDDLSYVEVSNATRVPNARYVVYQKHSNMLASATVCEAADERTEALCQQLGGEVTTPATQSGYTAYLLTGTNNRVPGTCKVGTATFAEGQTLGSSGVKCGVVCQNGTCENTLTDRTVYDTNYTTWTSVCIGSSTNSCVGNEFKGKMTTCRAIAENSCAYSTFSGYASSCDGFNANACANASFSGAASRCSALSANACTGSTFNGRDSFCNGGVANGCAGALIQAGAYCQGNCVDTKYGVDPTGKNLGIGSCLGASCPAGVPLLGNWNASNGSYNINGWKDGYCDATAMITGVCPTGSPTGSATTTTDKTTAAGWYGGYCDPLMNGTCPAGSPTASGKCWNGNGNEIDC